VGRAKRVFSPLDKQLGLQDKHYSAGVLKEMVWLSGVVGSFAEAEVVFERIGRLTISDSSIWRRKEKWGEAFKAIEEAEREKANTLSRAHEFRERVLGLEKRKGVSMDGTMVHIRDEGWKELKVGCCFDIEVYSTWNKVTKEWEDLAHAVDNRYPQDYQFAWLIWAARSCWGRCYGQRPSSDAGRERRKEKWWVTERLGYGTRPRSTSMMHAKSWIGITRWNTCRI
jgi:hypothetical protein